MKEVFKQLIVLLLIVTMVTGMVPASVFAAIEEKESSTIQKEKALSSEVDQESEKNKKTENGVTLVEPEPVVQQEEIPQTKDVNQNQGISTPTAPVPSPQSTEPESAVPEADKNANSELKVENNISLIQSPESVDAAEGDTVTFSAQIQADKPQEVSYQWQKTTEGGESSGPQSTQEALEEKKQGIENIQSGLGISKETLEISEQEKTEKVAEIKNTPITVSNENWEDLPGETNTTLTVTVDANVATKGADYRLVARTAEAAVASRTASVRSNSLFAGGSGTAKDPFLIRTYDQLYNVRYYKGSYNQRNYFMLMSNIDATGRGWKPIGGYDDPFFGNFNGNGYVVKNLNVTQTVDIPTNTWKGIIRTPGAGFFGYVDSAEIQNVGVQDLRVSITGAVSPEFAASAIANVGGIAVCGQNTVIRNCFVKGSISAYASADLEAFLLVGGIVGGSRFARDAANSWFTGRIENCYSSVTLNLTTAQASIQEIKRGAVLPSSNLGSGSRPSVIHSFYDTSKTWTSGGGTPRSSWDFTNKDKICKELNDYAESNDLLNYWEMDSQTGYPTLMHREPLDFIITNYRQIYDGYAKEANFTVNHPSPEANVGKEWFYGYYQGNTKISAPKEVGTYDIKIAIDPSRNYYIGKVVSDPYDYTPNSQDKARLIINPKPDKAEPDFGTITYKKSDGSQYTPDEWTDKDVVVTFKLKDHADGPTRKVWCGDTLYEVDNKNNEVSGIKTVTLTDNVGKTYTATETSSGSGEYRATISIPENSMIGSVMTITAEDKKGNKTTTTTENIKINKYSLDMNVNAYLDGETKGSEMVPVANKYIAFAREQADFEINTKGAQASPDLYAKSIAYKFVDKNKNPNPADVAYTEKSFSDPTNPHKVTASIAGPFDGKLYVKAVSSNGKIIELQYQIMVENYLPAINITKDAKIGIENGNATKTVPYQEGQSYQSVQVNVDWKDTESPMSGIATIEAFRSDTKASIGKITVNPKEDRTGGLQARNVFDFNQSGNYKAIIVVTDVAGNSMTQETEELHIGSAAPELTVEWKKPSTTDKNPLGVNYGFGNWSDKEATLELKAKSSDAQNPINGKLNYYYRTAVNNEAFGGEWQLINQTPANSDETVTFTPTTQGDFNYQFKVMTESKLTNDLNNSRSVKIDTITPDKVMVETNVQPNDQNWYTAYDLRKVSNELSVTLSLPNLDVSNVTAYYDTYFRAEDAGNTDNKENELSGVLQGRSDSVRKLNLKKDGVYTLKTYTLDEAGNKTPEAVYTYKIDKTGPSINSIIHKDEDGETELGSYQNVTPFKFFKNKAGTLSINTKNASSKIKTIEYQKCADPAIKSNLIDGGNGIQKWENETIEKGVWQKYDANKLPENNPDFKGSIFVKIIDEAGNRFNYRTENFVLDKVKPEITVTPREDISKWQQKVTFDIIIKDTGSGIEKIRLKEIEDPNNPYEQTIDAPDFEKAQDGNIDFINRGITNFSYVQESETKVYKEVRFTYTVIAASYDHLTESKLLASVEDKASNKNEAKEISYKVDAGKPMVEASLKGLRTPPNESTWFTTPVQFVLKNTNVGTVLEEQKDGKLTRSGVTYFYSLDNGAKWNIINELPTREPYTFNYNEDVNAEILFKAESESGVVSDPTSQKTIKKDNVNPFMPEVTITPKDPQITGWYNEQSNAGKYPEIKVVPKTKIPILTAPESTYYKLYTGDGKNVRPSSLGQSLLNSSFNGSVDTAYSGIQVEKNKDSVADPKGKEKLSNTAITSSVQPVDVKEALGAQTYKAPEKKDVRIEKKEINILYIISNNGDKLRQWLSDAGNDSTSNIKVKVEGNRNLIGETFDSANGDNPTTYKFYKGNINSEANLIVTLNVSAVGIVRFNQANDPSAFLKKNSQYMDVVVTGMADENGTIQFGYSDKNTRVGTSQWNKIEKALNDYMQAGNGFYIGHDSIWTISERGYNSNPGNSSNTRQIMNEIFGPLGKIERSNGMTVNALGYDDNRWTEYNAGLVPGNWVTKQGNDAPRVEVKQAGYITEFPFSIGNLNETFETAPTHTNGQVAYGEIWVGFDKSQLKDNSDLDNTVLYDRQYDPAENGKDLFYLATNGNVGMSQIGHDPSKTTIKEKQLLVNTLVYLAQKPTSQFTTNDGKTEQVSAVIRSQDQLKKIGQPGEEGTYPIDGTYVLGDNIVLDNNYVPIKNFKGKFDGSNNGDPKSPNYTITMNGKALFESTEVGAKIAHFRISNGQLVENNNAAEVLYCQSANATKPMIGGNNSGNISYCKVYGSNEATSANITGRGAIVEQSTGSIQNCTVTAKVTASADYAGGIVGTTSSNVKSCNFVGSVTNSSGKAGGIVGYSNNTDSFTISQCKITGSQIRGNTDAGGILADAAGRAEVVDCSVLSTSVEAANHAGGIMPELKKGSMTNVVFKDGNITGKMAGGIVAATAEGSTLRNAEVKGSSKISATETAGGLIGTNAGRLENGYTEASVTSAPTRGGAVGINKGSALNTGSKGVVITGSETFSESIGGFVGKHENGRMNDCITDQANFAGSDYYVTDTAPKIMNDGIYTLEVWTEDESVNAKKENNKSEVYRQTLNVDLTPPQFTIQIDKNDLNTILNKITFGKLFNKTVDVKINAQDLTSGVDSITYKLYKVEDSVTEVDITLPNSNTPLEEATKKGSESVTFSIIPNFKGYVVATAKDKAGNEKEIWTEGINIASTMPMVIATPESKGTNIPYSGEWTNQDIEIGLAYDQNSSVGVFSNYQVSTDGGVTWSNISGSRDGTIYSVTSSDSLEKTYQFRAKITGFAGTDQQYSLTSKLINAKIDKISPTVSAPVFSNVNVAEKDGYKIYDKETLMTIIGSDTGGSGIASQEYKLSTGGQKLNYKESLLMKSGKYELEYSISDKAGNSTILSPTPVNFIVDTQKPNAPKLEKDTELEPGNYTAKDVRVKAAYNDTNKPVSDYENIYYQKYKNGVLQDSDNNGGWIVYADSAPVIINQDGSWELSFKAVTNAGHESELSKITINREADFGSQDDLLVKINGELKDQNYSTEWTNQNINVELSTTGVSLYGNKNKEGYYKYLKETKSINYHTFSVNAEGITTYDFKAENKANKEYEKKGYTFKLDTKAPDKPSITTGTDNKEINENDWYYDLQLLKIKDTTTEEKENFSTRTLNYRVYPKGSDPKGYVTIASLEKNGIEEDVTDLITAPGSWVLESYVSDEAGNASETTKKILNYGGSKDSNQASKPKVEITLKGTQYPSDDTSVDKPIYQGLVELSVEAKDDYLSINKVEFKLTNKDDTKPLQYGEWTPYKEPVNIENFNGKVEVQAINEADMKGEAQKFFIADSKKPDVSITEEKGKEQKSWNSEKYSLKVDGGNNTVSGFQKYEYSKDNGITWTTLEASNNPYSITNNGKQIFMVRAVNNAGIIGDSKTYEAWLDKEDLKLKIKVTAESVEGDWTKGTSFTPTLEEGTSMPASGITYYYSEALNDDGSLKNKTKLSNGSLRVENSTDNTGKTYYFQAISGTGIDSNIEPGTAYIDKVAPQKPVLSIQNNQAPDGNDEWYKTALSLKVEPQKADGQISAKLDVDGQERTTVQGELLLQNQAAPDEGQWQPLETYAINSDGIYTATGRAADQAKNISNNTKRETLKLDTTKPEIKDITYQKLSSHWWEKLIYNGAVQVTVTAEDTTSGVRSITYKTDDGTEKTIQPNGIGVASFKLDPDLNSNLTVWAEDVAGNVSETKTTENIRLEVEKPNVVISTTATPNSVNWYKGNMPYTVRMEDNVGIKSYKIYLTDAPITDFTAPGLTPIQQATLPDELTFKRVDYDDGKITTSGASKTVTVVVTDKAGNERIESQSFSIEVAAPMLTAQLTVPEAGTGAQIQYNGEATSSAVTAMMQLAAEPDSGVALLQYQIKDKDASDQWHSISGFSQRQHVVDEEVNQEYRFRMTTLADNTTETAFQKIYIDRQMPSSPMITVLDKNGNDVNGKWVNEVPSVTLETPGNHLPSVQKDCVYIYETTKNGATVTDQSGTVAITESETAKAITIAEEAKYDIQSWAKRGDLVDSDNIATGSVLFDKTAPPSAAFEYGQENGSRILKINIIDNLSGGESLKYKVNESDEEKTLVCRDNSVAWLDLSDLKQGDKISIVELTDKAGNTNRLTTPIVEIVKDSGPIITIDAGSFKPQDGWYKDTDLALTAKIKIKSRPEDKPADKVTGVDENGVPIYTNYPDTDTIANVVIVNAGGENSYKEYTDSKTEDSYTIAVPEQGKDLRVTVTVTDTWDNVSTATYTLSHDSIAPEAPTMRFTYVNGQPIPEDGTVSQDVILTLVPNTEKEDAGTSPLDNWEYSIDDGITWNSAIKISGSNSLTAKLSVDASKQTAYTVKTRITDKAGNVGTPSAAQSLITKDITPPVCKALTEQGGKPIQNGFVNQSPRILEIYAEDPSQSVISSGLKEWNYSLDGGTTWQPNNLPWESTAANTITLPGDGLYSLTFKVWDHAGNLSTAYPQTTVKQDSIAPVLDLGNVIYEQKTKDGSYEKAAIKKLAFGSFYNNSLRVTIPVTDALSGADSLSWQCSDGKSGRAAVSEGKAVIEWPIGLKGTITLSANDKAGNTVSHDLGSWCLEGEAPKAGNLISEEAISADGWYRSDVNFSIPVSDAGSGIAQISIQVDKNEPVVTIYNEQVQNANVTGRIDKDGIHRILVKMKDNAGNTSQRTYTVQVDHNSTLEIYIVENDGKDSIVDPDYWRSDDPVTLKAIAIAALMDNIESFSYTIDGGKTWSAPQSFKDKNTFEIHDDGIYQYEDKEGITHNLIGIRTTDKQGIQKQSLFVTINKDTDAPPFPDSKIDPEKPNGNADLANPEKVWYKETHPEVLLNPAPQEEKRAPVTSHYTLMETGAIFENPVALGVALREGKNVLRLEAWDEAGNVVKDKGLPYKEEVIYLDTIAPAFETPIFQEAKGRSIFKALSNNLNFGNFSKEAIKVMIPVSDETSGVGNVWVQIGSKMPIQAKIENSRAVFEIPAGTKDSIITYWSEDIAGNRSETKKLEKTSDKWTVDTEAPVYGEIKTDIPLGIDGYYSNDLRFELPITDMASGLAGITWQTDDQPPVSIDPITFSEGRLEAYTLADTVVGEGIHKILITAVDNAGNTSTKNLTFQIDYAGSSAAYVTLEDGKPVDANTWYSDDTVNLKVICEGDFDVDNWQYSTDGGKNWSAPILWSGNPIFSISQNGFYDAKNGEGVQVRINDKEPKSYESHPITLRKDNTLPDFPTIVAAEPNGNTDEKGITWYKGSHPSISVIQTPSPETQAPITSQFGLNGLETSFSGTRSLSAELEEGENTLWTAAQKSTGKKAQDEKGNDKMTKTLYIDTVAPELVSIQYKDLKNNPVEALMNWLSFSNFFNEGVRAELEVKDATSGLDTLTYTISGKTAQKQIKGSDQNTAVTSFDIPLGTDGTVTFCLSDKAGNQSAEYTLKKESDQWVLEDTAPVIGDLTTDAKRSDDGWYNKAIAYSIALGDADSGLAKVTAIIDSAASKTLERETFGDKKHKSYTYTDTLSGDGVRSLDIHAEDNADNGSDRSFALKIDTQAPSELKLTGMPPNGSDIKPVTLTVHAIDALSGLKSWQYTTDGGKTWSIAQNWDGSKHQIKLSEIGTYNVSFAVTDKADNTSVFEDTVQITIKEKPLPKPNPVLSIISPQNGDQNVALDQAALSFSSDQPIVKGTGSIALYRKDNNQKLAELSASSSRVTLEGQRITALFQAEYDPNTEYYVVVGEDFVQNDENTGNKVFGGSSDWCYKTVIDDTKVKILGFNVDLIKRSQIGGQEKIIQVAAVKSDEVPKQYNLLTTADYLGDDGKPYVKMKAYPQYNAKPGDVKITAKDKDGKDAGKYIRKNADGTFSIEMPKDAGRIIVSIVLGDDPNNVFNVVILDTGYEGEIISTGIEHRMDPSQVLNSVDLTKEIENPLTKFVKVVLNLNRKADEELTEEEKAVLKQATDKIIEEEQRQGSEVQYLHLSAQMAKWVTMLNQEGKEQEAVYSAITSLAGKLRITIALPQELQQYFSYKIVLIDNKTGAVLEPMISDDGSQLSFDIDDLATYSLAAFPTRVSLNYTAEQGGHIEGSTSQNLDIFKDGEPVKAVADTGYRFVDWNDGYTLPERQEKGVGSNRTYTARFEPMAEYTVVLSYNATEGGRIDGSSRQTLKKGDDGQRVTAIANAGWHFTSWSDGSTEASRQDTNVQADLQVTAGFEKDTPTPPASNPPTQNPTSTEISVSVQRHGSVMNLGMAGRNPLSGNEGADKSAGKTQQNANAKAGQNDSSQNNSSAVQAVHNCFLHWIILAMAAVVVILTELNLRNWRKRNKALEAELESEEEKDNV